MNYEKRHRCIVCGKIDSAKNMVRATFTKDQETRWGHHLCFDECNRVLVECRDPWRWKYEKPNAQDQRAGPAPG